MADLGWGYLEVDRTLRPLRPDDFSLVRHSNESSREHDDDRDHVDFDVNDTVGHFINDDVNDAVFDNEFHLPDDG